MTRPTRTRLADLRRIQAWPLLSWAGLSGRVHVDLDLLAAKDLGGMSATARQLWPEQFDTSLGRPRGAPGVELLLGAQRYRPVRAGGHRLSQTPIASINAETLDGFPTALEEVTSASATTLKQWRGRLFGLRQLLFECGQLPQPPQRGPVGGSTEQRLAAVPAPGIRHVMTRYVAARAAVLSRSSVNGLVNDLILFGEFLAGQLPRHHLAHPARTPPHRSLSGLEPYAHLARPSRPRPACLRLSRARHRADGPELPR